MRNISCIYNFSLHCDLLEEQGWTDWQISDIWLTNCIYKDTGWDFFLNSTPEMQGSHYITVHNVKNTFCTGTSGIQYFIYLSKKETTYHKKIFFIFQCSPPITQYTSPAFVATTLSPGKKKIFWLLFKPGRDRLLDFFIAWKSFTLKKFFHNSE